MFNTTRKVYFYDTHSKTVPLNRFRMSCGNIFVINAIIIIFYVVETKIVLKNCLRMSHSGNFIITSNEDNDGLVDDRLRWLNLYISPSHWNARAQKASFLLSVLPIGLCLTSRRSSCVCGVDLPLAVATDVHVTVEVVWPEFAHYTNSHLLTP